MGHITGKISRDEMKISRILLLSLFALATIRPHDVITTKLTYTRDISRILARRCQTCHSQQASIALTTYEETRPWAVAIKEQVLSRRMPPWGAVKGFGHLSPDHSLTQEEIMVIAAWVVGGAPKGDPAFLPAIQPTKQPLNDEPALQDALIVNNKLRIEASIAVAGIRPITTGTVESARITVSLPSGQVEPLLWLFHYDPTGNKVFRFRDAISLPPGSIVEAGSPLQFALETNR
jgi:hypothetical protein